MTRLPDAVTSATHSPHHPSQLVERSDTFGGELGHCVDGGAAGHAHLDRTQILQVARHGRLSGGDALLAEQLDQLRLVGDRVLFDQTSDRLLSLDLAHRRLLTGPRTGTP